VKTGEWDMDNSGNIVDMYENTDIEGRIDLFILHYARIEKILDGCEQNLCFYIKQSREYSYYSGIDELGVKIQTSGFCDPTYMQAKSNIEIMKAIKERDYCTLYDGLDENVIRVVARELDCIDDIREDFQTFKNSFNYLDDDEAEKYITYLVQGRRNEKVSYDYDIKARTFKSQMSRAKSVVVSKTVTALKRKYCIE